MVSFDDILVEVGPFGRAQKRIFALLCLVSLSMAWTYVGIVFQGYTPPHWCRQPGLEEQRQTCGWTVQDSVRRSVPLLNESGELQPNSCLQYDVELNQSAVSCEQSQDLDLSGAALTNCKNGWEYDYEGRKSFVTEFDLVCSDGWMVDMYQSTLNVGFLVGSFIFGYIADRFGRRISFLLCNIVSMICSASIALAPNFLAVLVLRAVLGLGIKGSWMTCYVQLTEIVGLEYRRLVGILYQMVISVGIIAMVMLAYYIPDWRWLQVVCSVPSLLFLSYFWFVPESPRWLLSQNRAPAALKITKKMAKENKKNLSVKNIESFEAVTDEPGDSPSASFLDLFRTPNMRKHTFILMFNWFCSALVYQGLIMRVGITDGNVYIDFLISGLVEFPAAFLILFTIERIGRRLPFATANFVAGAACFITAGIPDSMTWLKTAVACIGRLGITMAFEMVVFVNSELYPTYVRNFGVSVCSSLCDVGGIISPFILYRLAAVWIELPLIIFGVIACIAGGLVLLLPETKGVPLPETIDDIEFPNKKNNPQMEMLNHGTDKETDV
ncbi:solute carrier family 22 member 2-like [Boleophthalmus pectinirostris]|uniref:solute carrier family 22 member 2-like n=1 Tax=Boleophthalmus pectinirostris TaxID=150288 RepID=UPI00242B3F7F|nr:solute carrier family 22 member 2-like [Boleophthalmus pectinirostris]